ncbi:MAG: hypothetical protein HUK08_07885 [Bacteroidaceae bacterium]|nr:hypothetical protein [Bacteroidaceae bacterium]
MKLHIFNPEHDISLALNQFRFTPSNNVVRMRKDLAYIPILWAGEGDYVLVDDVEAAYRSADRLRNYIKPGARFIGYNRLKSVIREKIRSGFFDIKAEPWGWDKAVVYQLKSMGWPEEHLPTDDQLDEIRNVSHRRMAKKFLDTFNEDGGIVFDSVETSSVTDIMQWIDRYGTVMLKSPWSCSGRGVKIVDKERLTPTVLRWVENTIAQQGSIMIERYYNKLLDFAMEFNVEEGVAKFVGYSVFETCVTAYSSSMIASEDHKREILERYAFPSAIDETMSRCEDYLSQVLPKAYSGAVGIDMMMIKHEEGVMLHPCVEINVRRTMGHVALALPVPVLEPERQMVIEVVRNFALRVI